MEVGTRVGPFSQKSPDGVKVPGFKEKSQKSGSQFVVNDHIFG